MSSSSLLNIASQLGFEIPSVPLPEDSIEKSAQRREINIVESNINLDDEINAMKGFTLDMINVKENLSTIIDHCERLRSCKTFLNVPAAEQRIIKTALLELYAAASSPSEVASITQPRHILRERILRVIKNFESIAKCNQDYCQQLESICCLFIQ